MKLLFLLFVTAGIGAVVYVISSKVTQSKKSKKYNWSPLAASLTVVFILLGLITFGIYMSSRQPDMQCGKSHETEVLPPIHPTAWYDYFQFGNYDYDTGNCVKAITDYTKAINLNPAYPQAYNNRAYTYMRLRMYPEALKDLDKALSLNPSYIQALMNRADIHNYYYEIDRQKAIADYRKAISLGADDSTSVCGHLFLAEHNGWTPGAYVDFFLGKFRSCK